MDFSQAFTHKREIRWRNQGQRKGIYKRGLYASCPGSVSSRLLFCVNLFYDSLPLTLTPIERHITLTQCTRLQTNANSWQERLHLKLNHMQRCVILYVWCIWNPFQNLTPLQLSLTVGADFSARLHILFPGLSNCWFSLFQPVFLLLFFPVTAVAQNALAGKLLSWISLALKMSVSVGLCITRQCSQNLFSCYHWPCMKALSGKLSRFQRAVPRFFAFSFFIK